MSALDLQRDFVPQRAGIKPDAVLTATGDPIPDQPCPMCGAMPDAGPEGAHNAKAGKGWNPEWHCWQCGYRPGQTASAIGMLASQRDASVAALNQAKDEIMAMLLQAMTQSQASQAPAVLPDAPDAAEVAALHERIGKLEQLLVAQDAPPDSGPPKVPNVIDAGSTQQPPPAGG